MERSRNLGRDAVLYMLIMLLLAVILQLLAPRPVCRHLRLLGIAAYVRPSFSQNRTLDYVRAAPSRQSNRSSCGGYPAEQHHTRRSLVPFEMAGAIVPDQPRFPEPGHALGTPSLGSCSARGRTTSTHGGSPCRPSPCSRDAASAHPDRPTVPTRLDPRKVLEGDAE